MLKYITQRILLMLITLFIITFVCFVLIRMLPPAVLPEGDPHTPVVEARREAMGYNKPYLIQFGIFIRGIFTRWDFGLSDKLFWGQEVIDVFLAKLPATVLVNLYSIIFSIPIGIMLGVWAALKKNIILSVFQYRGEEKICVHYLTVSAKTSARSSSARMRRAS